MIHSDSNDSFNFTYPLLLLNVCRHLVITVKVKLSPGCSNEPKYRKPCVVVIRANPLISSKDGYGSPFHSYSCLQGVI